MLLNEKKLRKHVLNFISESELKNFHEISLFRSFLALSSVFVSLLVCLFIISHISEVPPLTAVIVSIVLIIFIGTRINALNVQTHEASHKLLAKRKSTNDLIGNIFCSYWILYDVDLYRKTHALHHKYLHESQDPDKQLYLLLNFENRFQILRLLITDLIGISAIKRVISIFSNSSRKVQQEKSSKGVMKFHIFGKLICQSIIILILFIMFGIYPGFRNYLLYWIVPLFCVYPFLIRLRVITEHFSPKLQEFGSLIYVSRTSRSTFLENYLLGAQMDFHMEHHLFPSIPFYKLKKLHSLLIQRGFFSSLESEQKELLLSGGYLSYWRRLLF